MSQPGSTSAADEDSESMRSLVEGIVRALVDSKNSVVVKAICGESGTSLRITVAPEDIGKVVGKEGRTARSLQIILTAASKKVSHRFSIDVQEAAKS